MTSEQIKEIENKLQYEFSDKQLLVTAFTHSSYANVEHDKNKRYIENYERMAFWGDAILRMVVAEYLYDVFPDKNKGEMSYMCSGLVSREGLFPVIENLGLTKHLQIVTAANDKLSEHLCADLYEAVVCAIYRDGGYSSARKFILNNLSSALHGVNSVRQKDSKTILQEYCQGQQPQKIVTYVQAGRTGTDNNPTYIIDLLIDNEYECSGQGSSKKSAEQDAAKKLVTKWRID